MMLTLLALASLLGWLYLTFGRGLFWLPVEDTPAPAPQEWPSVDIVVPARNEAESLPKSLPSLLAQDYPGQWRVLLIDDHSTDGTGGIAKQLAFSTGHAGKLTVIQAPELQQGWSGKVAAMQTGVTSGESDFILFTDADIEHPKDSLRRLVARAQMDKLDLVSLMVKLNCESNLEKWLIPAFVFFFSMLYPFRRVNDPNSGAAAAAGGVMLVKRRALKNAGGLERIRPAIIDDCALARIIKDNGGEECSTGNIRLFLTQNVKSLRVYQNGRDITDMIARTAFTQLRYSLGLLIATTAGLLALFIFPLLTPLLGSTKAALAAYGAWGLITAIYMPIIRYYKLPWIWTLTLPAAAGVYIAATLESARRYWQGKGGQWKGRAQAS